jgi:hypothetical protein
MISGRAQRLFEALAARPIPKGTIAELVASDSLVLIEIVSATLRTGTPAGGWYLGGICERLPVTALEELAAQAVRYRSSGPNDAADDVIADVCLQHPAAFTAYLPVLWDLAPNQNTYYAEWPWRAAGGGEIARLLDIVQADGADAARARDCLLQTRQPDLLGLLGARPHELLQAGYRREPGGALAELHSESPWHLAFPAGVLDQWAARHPWRDSHPTWPAAEAGLSAITSGFLDQPCPHCPNRLHRLLSLAPVPPGVPIASRQRVEYVWCAGCSPFTHATYVRHDQDGTPAEVSMDFVIQPPDQYSRDELESWFIPETRVELVTLGQRWQRQDWAQSNSRQNLHRVGGEPTWIQNPDYPACPECATNMNSAGQIAVEDLWYGEGICYLHWCDTCALSAVVYQQT